MRLIGSALVVFFVFFSQAAFASKFLYLNGIYSPETYFGPNPSGGDLQVHEPMWVEYKGDWVYPSFQPDPSLMWLSNLITSAYNADPELTTNGEGCYSYEPIPPQYQNYNGTQASTVTFARLLSGCTNEEKVNKGRVLKSARFYSCPEGQEPVGLPSNYECLTPPSCSCSSNYNATTKTCSPMQPETTWDPIAGIYYTYPDNNHDDADRCSMPAPEKESYGRCSENGNSTSTNNPINCATGQKHYTEVDYQGFGLDALNYSRYYQTPDVSESESSALLSVWRENNTPSLSTVTHDDGAVSKIFRIGNKVERIFFFPAGSNSYQVNGGLMSISLDEADNTVTLHSGKKYKFNNETGTVSEALDAHGVERFQYTYVIINGEQKVSRVTNRFGRYLDYIYNPAGQLIQLTDQDGISVYYEYDAAQNLTKVIYPDGTPNDLTDNPTKEYLFENTDFPFYVTGIVDQDGTRLASIEYNADGKAVSSELHDGAERVEVSYPSSNQSIVKFYRDTNLSAYREEQYTFGRFRGQYKLTSKVITRCENCELSSEYWEYDDRELLTRHTSPAGKVTEYSYDDQSRKISETVAVGTAEVKTTAYTWNDEHNKIESIVTATDVTTYTFDTQGNTTNTLITPVQ